MADREAMIEAVQTHLRASTEGDFEQWRKIWSDDAVIEDPVGYGLYRGMEEISTKFWPQSRNASPRLTLLEDVIVCGHEAIAIMSAEVGAEDARRVLQPVVDHFTFNEAGQITGMRAFFNFG